MDGMYIALAIFAGGAFMAARDGSSKEGRRAHLILAWLIVFLAAMLYLFGEW